MLLLSCAQIFRGHIYDTVCVDVKCHLNLRNTTSCWRDSIESELSKRLVILCKLALALYDIDIYSRLVIRSR